MNSVVCKGIHAAGSGVAGQALNALPTTNTGRDGRLQDAVIIDLQDQVEDLEGDFQDDLQDELVHDPFVSKEGYGLILTSSEVVTDLLPMVLLKTLGS